jgi:hypothetical protein
MRHSAVPSSPAQCEAAWQPAVGSRPTTRPQQPPPVRLRRGYPHSRAPKSPGTSGPGTHAGCPHRLSRNARASLGAYAVGAGRSGRGTRESLGACATATPSPARSGRCARPRLHSALFCFRRPWTPGSETGERPSGVQRAGDGAGEVLGRCGRGPGQMWARSRADVGAVVTKRPCGSRARLGCSCCHYFAYQCRRKGGRSRPALGFASRT